MSYTSSSAGKVSVQPQALPEDATYPHAMSVEISPPWDQEGVWVLRSPETIGSNHGLLFIDHHRADMAYVTEPENELRWKRSGHGHLYYQARLDNGVTFKVQVEEKGDSVSIYSTFTNDFLHPLSNIGNQYCLMNTGVKGFEDPKAERTFIRVNGEWLPLNRTKPGIEKGLRPFFIVTNTADLPPLEKVQIERSWWADEQADIPLIATVSEDGRRIVALAFDNSYKIMTNAEIPCIHADPMFSDVEVGGTVDVRGKVYFVEGALDELLPLFFRDFPEWKERAAAAAAP